MAAVQAKLPVMRPSNGPLRGKTRVNNQDTLEGSTGEAADQQRQVAHTLTACTRCRHRKTRCDPGLPRCAPCERTNSTCEYFDSAKGRTVNRNYVIYLQHKVRELEEELDKVENEDSGEDPEAMMRAADVSVQDAKDSKYLGPASGIAITRLVMQLAKQFTDATSIKDVVSEQRARQIKELNHQEQAKPTSKIYPLISDVAAEQLPNRSLGDLLVQLYKVKVQPMYPALHEPTLDHDLDMVYTSPHTASDHQHFVIRMVIAVSLQKMDTQYAGLADSYYLAALKYLEPVVRKMDWKTLQCFALMAEYSLLTPTRTAIYYVLGIAVRLVQALGYHEEKTITRDNTSGNPNGKANFLEIDMRRRLYWCIIVMDFGLAHALGRPAMLATSLEHIDVNWFESVDDEYITPDGIKPSCPGPTLKKWIAIHFFKMRLLQLEIRRTLYQRKRATPKDDSDPWFHRMDAKLAAWKDAAPSADEGAGLDKIWFIGRYNTMVVFLYRPSPQVPRPTVTAALKCFDACEYNIVMQREQITKKNVDLTWIFTQSIFMSINTVLWSLSYVEVRRKHSRASVEKSLEVAMDSIQLASERWPGVASAVQLYSNLISAILKIYEKDGDVPISAATPSEAAPLGVMFPDDVHRSRATSPGTASIKSVATPPDTQGNVSYFQQRSRGSIEQPPPMPYRNESQTQYTGVTAPSAQHSAPIPSSSRQHLSSDAGPSMQHIPQQQQQQQEAQQMPQSDWSRTGLSCDLNGQYDALPEYTFDLTVPSWSSSHPMPSQYASIPGMPTYQMYPGYNNGAYDTADPMAFTTIDGSGQLEPHYWNMDSGAFGTGLNQADQANLLHTLENDGMEGIQSMISATMDSIAPKHAHPPTY